MAMQRTKLADIQYVPSSAGSIYANPASTKTFIRSLLFHNTNSTTETIKVYNVPDSTGAVGTASAGNRFLSIALPSGDTFEFSPEYPMVLTDENDSIQAETTTASEVTVQVIGDQDV